MTVPGMFNLKLFDHLHLTFAHVTRGARAHAESAMRLSRRALHFRIVEVLVLGGAVAASLAAALGAGRWSGILTAVLASLALAVYVAWLASNLEPRIDAHRWCAERLWLFGERYRALLADMDDGAMSVEAARDRRDRLTQELQGVYEHAPLLEPRVYEHTRAERASVPNETPSAGQTAAFESAPLPAAQPTAPFIRGTSP
jgi:hypothetical protein